MSKRFRDYAANNSVKDWLFIHLQMQGPSAFIDNVIMEFHKPATTLNSSIACLSGCLWLAQCYFCKVVQGIRKI